MDAGEKRAKPIQRLRVTEKAWKERNRRMMINNPLNQVNYFDRVKARGDGRKR